MPQPSRIVETHVSTLVFLDDRVFKIKKPVRTGFLDFTDADARRLACLREVELNRRLAADIYLGVADVVIEGEAIDHMVVMRRLAEERRLSARLEMPGVDDDLRRVAHLVATFHAAADRSPGIDEASGHAAVAGLWDQGLEQLAAYSDTVLGAGEVDRAGSLVREYLRGRAPLFEERIAAGRACDGHGDLQAEDIFVLDDGPRILDCLEFDDRLRYGDALADVAFLAMDLERLGHPELGASFLKHYQELSGDRWPSSLAHHHIAYRAHVRAKVACLRHDQGDAAAGAAARRLHLQALDHLAAARVRMVVVGGSPGTGKSAVSRELAERIDAVLLSSDLVRDDLFPRTDSDRSVGDDLDQGRYAPERSGAVYDELLRRARLLLEHGESVVLDASWLEPERRDAARRLGEVTASVVSELRCACSDELAAGRIARRTSEGADPSEATAAIARRMADRAVTWPEAVLIDTEGSLGDSVGLAEAVATRS